MKIKDNYEIIIGLEIHIRPITKRKMFCFCDADIWGAEPNTHTCPSCLGLPGGLPTPNKEAIKKCHSLGIGTNCKINFESFFERKHYFYPDLSKSYQISQNDLPLCIDGMITVDNQDIRIRQIHMEEDTGKNNHSELSGKTLLDFNPCGMPLIELVTQPDIRDVETAYNFAKKVIQIAQDLGISDCEMQKGNARLEPSISVRKKDVTELPPYRVELKNINSFKFMKDALN